MCVHFKFRDNQSLTIKYILVTTLHGSDRLHSQSTHKMLFVTIYMRAMVNSYGGEYKSHHFRELTK